MTVLELLSRSLIRLDGGTGSLLQAAGLRPGEPSENWTLSHPEVLTDIHKRYYDAGSNAVCTNTFGVNGLKYTEDEVVSFVRAAVDNARRAADASINKGEKFVALDIGPLGRMLSPFGDLSFEEAVAAFAVTVRAGADAGADFIFIETMNDGLETKAALLATKENSSLPVFVSNAYGEDGRLMSGASPEAMIALLEGMGADAVGVNCSLGPDALAPVVREYLKYASVPVIMKPNAGMPEVRDGRTVYNVSPADFAASVASLVCEGVSVIGGCCGTTPEYIAALTEATAGAVPLPIRKKNLTVISSGTHAVYISDDPVLIGERINPTGKKRFRQALAEHDMGYILGEGVAEEKAGVHVLDVNVGTPGIDEAAMLEETVRELQAVCSVPLQLDTSDPDAMERALRVYNGKAMINSVNGKRESMDAVFPLVKKYGGVVVALTLDEDGIPETAEGRLAVAKKILARAKEYGLSESDMVFDPLTLTVSADKNAAAVTLESLRLIKSELGCRTVLGVSNVSFGLPAREKVTAAFFALALEAGLSAAIMNPFSDAMCDTYHAFRVLRGFDENCASYISYAQDAKPAQTTPETAVSGIPALSAAVENGLCDDAAKQAKALLADTPAMTLIREGIIPALDRVGKGFEEKTVFLPGLLMSAEAAGAAFEVIKCASAKDASPRNFRVILATVKGDVHDIGKNIVRLLLENYGFEVTDLGRDVAPEEIVKAALETGAPLVGLSALMTTTVPAMAETVRLLHEAGTKCKIVVGGAVLTEEYAASIGADKYAADAMDTVRYAEALQNS